MSERECGKRNESQQVNRAHEHNAKLSPIQAMTDKVLGRSVQVLCSRSSFKSERGTSRHCSLCGEKHKNGRKQRGLYHCKTHNILMNANVNGAYNILYGRKVAAGSGSRPMVWPMLLHWDGCGWNRNNGMPTLERSMVEA